MRMAFLWLLVMTAFAVGGASIYAATALKSPMDGDGYGVTEFSR